MPSLCAPTATGAPDCLSGGVRGEEWQDGLSELARPDLGEGMAAAREDLDFRPGDQPRQLLGKVGRGYDVVLGADDQGGRLDARQAFGPVEGEDRVDPAGRDLGRRKDGEVMCLDRKS